MRTDTFQPSAALADEHHRTLSAIRAPIAPTQAGYGHQHAQREADRLNQRDQGVLTYSVLSIGSVSVIVVRDAQTGVEVGLLP